jgi:hypothetical protein
MASRERWLFCRSCKLWHTVPCSRTSSKFLMLSILGLLLQTRPINAAEMQGKGDYSIADSHRVAVYEHRYDAVLDASTSIIMIKMPFLRLRAEMGKLRTAMEKASKQGVRSGKGTLRGTRRGTGQVRNNAEQHSGPFYSKG